MSLSSLDIKIITATIACPLIFTHIRLDTWLCKECVCRCDMNKFHLIQRDMITHTSGIMFWCRIVIVCQKCSWSDLSEWSESVHNAKIDHCFVQLCVKLNFRGWEGACDGCKDNKIMHTFKSKKQLEDWGAAMCLVQFGENGCGVGLVNFKAICE